jgi:hypothetical protein
MRQTACCILFCFVFRRNTQNALLLMRATQLLRFGDICTEEPPSPWSLTLAAATACAAKCARANFASKWLRPSHRPPQRRPTLLLRACIHYALGSEAAPRRYRRNKEKRKKMKEEESTHTHHTNVILLGASVSDHPQNFTTKEANSSPTHWQTPANFSFVPYERGGAHSAPQIEAGARFRHAPRAPFRST